jgi:hypothetical protein
MSQQWCRQESNQVLVGRLTVFSGSMGQADREQEDDKEIGTETRNDKSRS